MIRGMHTYPPHIVSSHRLEVGLRRGDIEREIKVCKLEVVGKDYDVQSMLDHCSTLFGDIPRGRPPDRKLVKGFSKLTTPFTYLTKRGAFGWKNTTQRAFYGLKEVMSIFPVMVLSYFTQPFVL